MTVLGVNSNICSIETGQTSFQCIMEWRMRYRMKPHTHLHCAQPHNHLWGLYCTATGAGCMGGSLSPEAGLRSPSNSRAVDLPQPFASQQSGSCQRVPPWPARWGGWGASFEPVLPAHQSPVYELCSMLPPGHGHWYEIFWAHTAGHWSLSAGRRSPVMVW